VIGRVNRIVAAVGLALIACASMLALARATTPTEIIFGPKKYVVGPKGVSEFTWTVSVPATVTSPFVLRAVNGDSSGAHRVASGTLWVNGVKIDQQSGAEGVPSGEAGISLKTSNTLKLRIGGTPGAYVTFTILGTKRPPKNQPPVVTAGPDQTITLPASASLTGTVKDDGLPSGQELKIAWERRSGAGSVTFADPATPVTTATFSAAGQYILRLNADDSAYKRYDDVTIVVKDPPPNATPTADAGGPYSAIAAQDITFTGTGTDADGDPLAYAWDFGDGSKGSGAQPSHAFASEGTFTITLTVTDGRGGSAVATTTAAIAPPPPPPNQLPQAVAGGPYAAVLGNAIAFSGSASSDPDGDSLAYAWDFGDGSKATGPTPSHTYATSGPFTVTLTVDDGRGGTSAATATATISAPPPVNRAPTANAGGAYAALTGAAVNFNGTGSADPDGDALTYAWTFGDGATGTGATPSHVYKSPGTFTIGLTVGDGRGGTNSASTSAADS
jgi:PKD repeat protein